MAWQKTLLAIVLSGGAVFYGVGQLPLSDENPVKIYWEKVNTKVAAAYHVLQNSKNLEPDGGVPDVLLPFTAAKGCDGVVRKVALQGVTQLDADKLAREAPLLEDKPFDMAESMRMLRYVREAYQRADMPVPVVSLRLDKLCPAGNLMVFVSEDVQRAAATPPRELMARVMHDVEAMLAAPPVPGRPIRRDVSGRPLRVMTVDGHGVPMLPPPPPLEDEALTYKPVAPLQPPPALPGEAPVADWGDARADMTAEPWADVPAAKPGDDRLLLLAAMVNGRMALDGFEAYLDDVPGQAWVPLGLLVRAMDFPITVDAGAGVVKGWAIREENTLELNMKTQTLKLAGKEVPYPGGDIQRHEDDIYVRNRLLEQLFPLAAKLDLHELRLLIVSKEELPVDARLEREAQWQAMQAQQQLEASRIVSDAVNIPYALFSTPQVRVDGNINTSMPAQGQATTTGGLSVQSEGDLLYGTGHVTLTGTRDAAGHYSLSDARVNVLRQELTPNLLGPLKATSVEGGDITAARSTLSRGETQGRGVRISNRPFQRIDDPDRFVVEGTAPVGWDVEVYQNQSLLAYQRIGSDGHYRFEALPLKVGLNLFRLVQYGPQGQRKESLERYVLGSDMPNPGEVQYDAALLQPGSRLIDTTGANNTGKPLQATARMDVGLTNNLAATVGGYGLGALGGASTTAPMGLTAGLRGTVGGTYLTADTLRTREGAQTHAFSARSNIGTASDLRLGYLMNNGFDPTDEPIKNRLEGELGTQASLGKFGLNSSMGAGRNVNRDGSHELEVQNRSALTYERLALTNTLTRTMGHGGGQTRGELELAGGQGGVTWRGNVLYQPGESEMLKRASLSGHVPLGGQAGVDGTVSYVPAPEAYMEATGAIRYDFGNYALGLQGRGDTLGNAGVGVNFSTLFVPQDGLGYKQVHPSYGSGLGRALVKVFVDRNGNGQFDQGEKLLPNVMVRNRSRGTQHSTDSKGLAVVDNLLPYQPVKLALDEETLPDIFLKAAREDVTLISHPGANGMVDIPVRLYGEVVGSLVTAEANGVIRPVGGLMVQLVDAKDAVVDYAVSEADGYFAMAPVPLGSYRLRLRDGESRVSGYSVADDVAVDLTESHNSIDNITLNLTQNHLPQEGGVEAVARPGAVVVP